MNNKLYEQLLIIPAAIEDNRKYSDDKINKLTEYLTSIMD